MSLSLWEYFWTEADWVAGPSSSGSATVVVVRDAGAQGHDYHPLPDEFWEIREHHLRKFVEPVLKKVIPLELESAPPVNPELELEKDELFILQYKRNAALRRAYAAETEEELHKTAARVIKLTLDISNNISQYYERAAIILLFDLF